MEITIHGEKMNNYEKIPKNARWKNQVLCISCANLIRVVRIKIKWSESETRFTHKAHCAVQKGKWNPWTGHYCQRFQENKEQTTLLDYFLAAQGVDSTSSEGRGLEEQG